MRGVSSSDGLASAVRTAAWAGLREVPWDVRGRSLATQYSDLSAQGPKA